MKLPNIKNLLYEYLTDHGTKIELDVFLYGYDAALNYLLYMMFTFPIALILGETIEVLVFLFFFIPLRRYIGGYHFNSKVLCLIFSVFFSLIIPYLAITFGQIHFYFRIIILIIMIIITFKIKAVDHPNKRISVVEKLVYTKKSLIIEISYSILILMLYNESTYPYLNIAFLSTIFCVIGILIARLKTLRYNI